VVQLTPRLRALILEDVASDAALMSAAELLCGMFRKEGAVARNGGDELAVLLAGADAAAAQHAVERLARRLDDHNRTTDGPPLQPATGAATGEMGCRPAELLAQADAVMYGDKRDGRTDRGGDSGSEGGGT